MCRRDRHSGHPSTAGQAQDRVSSLAKDRRSANCATQPTMAKDFAYYQSLGHKLHREGQRLSLRKLQGQGLRSLVCICVILLKWCSEVAGVYSDLSICEMKWNFVKILFSHFGQCWHPFCKWATFRVVQACRIGASIVCKKSDVHQLVRYARHNWPGLCLTKSLGRKCRLIENWMCIVSKEVTLFMSQVRRSPWPVTTSRSTKHMKKAERPLNRSWWNLAW